MTTPSHETQLLNVRETARRLGVHENTIRNWADRGVLDGVRLPHSRFRRFDAGDVERIAREMRQPAPADECRLIRTKRRGRAVQGDW